MAVNVPNPGTYLQQLGQHVTTFRDALQVLINDSAYLNKMGGSAFLQAPPFSMTQEDADMVMAAIGQANPSNANLQTLLAWIESTQPLWGGQ